jgi:hypothetical protein
MEDMSEKIYFYQGQANILGDKDENSEKIEKIKNKVNEFFNMKNIHFLLGSGTSCDAIPNMAGMFDAVNKKISDYEGDYASELSLEFDSVLKKLKSNNNLEEVLGTLYSHKAYLENHNKENSEKESVELDKKNEKNDLSICMALIELIEEEIYNKIRLNFSQESEESSNEESSNEEVKKVLERYENFYRKIALRNKDLSRINIFTTNNDLFNEMALSNLNIHYINGFGNGLNKYFNPALFNYTFSKRMDTSIEKFEPVENMVYLFKLHGSINWIEDDSNLNTFFNIREILDPSYDKTGKNILIYPTPTKQNKSLGSPYADIFREFQKKLLLPNSVLFVIGYSFSDEHVNNIIYQALATNSSINIVVFNSLSCAAIGKVDDSRFFRIWGKHNGENIHYFNFLSKNLIPNLDSFGNQDDSIEKFVDFFKNNINKK